MNEELLRDDGGVSGEMENSEEVVDGRDNRDLKGILIASRKASDGYCLWESGDGSGEGEREPSLLLSLGLELMLSSCFSWWSATEYGEGKKVK